MAEGVRPARARRVGFEKDRGVLAVQTEAGFSFARVGLDARQAPGSPALPVLRQIAGRSLSIRLVRIHTDGVSFVAPGESLPGVREALLAVGLPCELSEDCAVVTVVAPNMRSIPSLMARMGEALAGRGIEVYQTADSHSSVSCVVARDRMADAGAALRAEFGLAEEETPPA